MGLNIGLYLQRSKGPIRKSEVIAIDTKVIATDTN
jgi:hypothetical protein